MDVTELNSCAPVDAAHELGNCCGSVVWVDRMVAARPFRDTTAVLTTAEEIWWDLGADDWQEAFAAHPPMPGIDSEYEDTFGHPYLVFVTNQSAAELSAIYQRRLHNNLLSELGVTATEQARITNLSLRRLLDIG